LGLGFIWYSVGVWRMPEGDEKMVPAKKLFAFSILYLFAIFSALMIDHLVATLWLTTGGAA
jgi:protoheme IX farnesyltransferase